MKTGEFKIRGPSVYGRPKKKTYIRRVVGLNDQGLQCKHSFFAELPPGVIYTDEITFTDARGQGFAGSAFAMAQYTQGKELLDQLFRVEYVEKKSKTKKR